MRTKSFKFNGEDKVLFWCCFDIRRVMGAMLRTYQITMGRAYYKCTLRFSSTSNVTDTVYRPLIHHRLTRRYLHSKALLSLYRIHPQWSLIVPLKSLQTSLQTSIRTPPRMPARTPARTPIQSSAQSSIQIRLQGLQKQA